MRLKTNILITVFALFFVFPIFAYAGDFGVQFNHNEVDSVNAPASTELNLTDNFTIEMRFRIDDCSGSGLFTGMLAQNQNNLFNNYTYVSLLDDTQNCDGFEVFVQGSPEGGGGGAFHTCEASVNDGNFHTLIWERNGQDFSCKIDGKNAFVFGFQDGFVGISATNTLTQIGNFDQDTSFGGIIQYTRIDIDGTCAGLWEFTEGSGTTVADTCGSVANDAIFFGAPTWFDFLTEATGIRYISRNTASNAPIQLGANVISGVGSVFPLVLLSIAVFLTFYIIQRIMFMFPQPQPEKKGRRGKKD